MHELSFRCVGCKGRTKATDEYHWFMDDGQEIVWHLCDKCCEFAVDVVESISQLDNEKERETWTL